MTVLSFFLVHVLGAAVEVVVRVIDAVVRNEFGQMTTKVLHRAVLPLVDQERASGVSAEGYRHAVGYAGVLDGPPQVVGQVGEFVTPGRRHFNRRRLGLHSLLLSGSRGATGRSN